MWIKILRDFCQSNRQDSLLVIYLGKNTTEKDLDLLEAAVNLIGADKKENILAIEYDEKFSPAALRQGTHFITTREMSTLAALDYLWDTDVKIVSALDNGIFD